MSRKARWLAEWRGAAGKPVLYHALSRIVDRRFVLGTEEKEKFRALMRMQENFTGCRALSYCLMDNHFHIMLEVPPMAESGLSDEELLKRLSAIYGEVFVAEVAIELGAARSAVYTDKNGMDEAVASIHKRFTYRMQDLGEFMKGLLQRFSTEGHSFSSTEGHSFSIIIRSKVLHESESKIVGGMAGECGEAGFVSCAFKDCGSAVCAGDGGKGEIPDPDAHAGKLHGVPGAFLLPDGQPLPHHARGATDGRERAFGWGIVEAAVGDLRRGFRG
jgi:Transposase IS200 like